ncbi:MULTISPECIES: DNA-3-methyladenine glycosylase family protein [unclassified Xanthobacter]|uniref:DNA-3-methyladenine glycosylase family protein n=1 Tax=unclassified Xanthobacter TaxID=2623496 RepID=UPI001EDDD4A7|nr:MULTISPECIES: DNA-3-methyladenine glycosylase 2 family protein [unclassified Xanthobacter]
MPAPPLLLQDQAGFEAAFAALLRLDPRLVPLAARTGCPALRRRPPGFEGLVAIVVAQQLSVAAARAIAARLEQALGGPASRDRLRAAAPEQLRAAGLSTPKIRTLKGIVQMLDAGAVDLCGLHALPMEAATHQLMRLPGIGRWSADLYLLFCLGRADAFPAGDLALQVALGDGFALGGRCTQEGLLAIAEDWRPLRGVAAHLLWAYYAVRRSRLGAPA